MRRNSLFTLAILFAGSCFAEAVIWYRFDDQEPLTSTAAGVYVTNCVAATYPAHPRTINGTTYDNENSPNTAYLPTYTNSAPAGYGVYDPVTGKRVTNRGCLHFRTTGSGDQKGGFLRITQDAALEALTNLTLEAFVRLDPAVKITSSYMRPIILKAYQSTQGTWGLHVFESNLFHRATLVYDDGTKAACGWGNGSRSVRVDDGRWHHLAVTYDFAAQEIKAYVDYSLIRTTSMLSGTKKAVGFYHPSNSPLQIGGNANNTTRRHCGEIDEVRISDEVLPPEKFLRYIPWREIDADTMLYLPFDTQDWFCRTAPPFNAATNVPGALVTEYTASSGATADSDDVPGDGIRTGVYSTNRFTNASAIHMPVSAVGPHNGTSFLLSDPNKLICASNFTFETFLKTDRQTTKPADSQYADSFAIFHTGFMKLLINGGANGALLFRYIGSDGAKDKYYSTRIDDGQWHHVAYVYDAALGRVTGYVDYRQVITNDVGRGGSGVNIRISGESAGYQTLAGCLDEVRITRRALSPTEFLTTHDCVRGTTLAHADFEEDMNLSPDTGLIASGVASARTGGSVPELSDLVPGRIALDGEAMQDVRDNKKSVRIDGGRIVWKEQSFLNLSTFTVEFFAKLDSLDSSANLIRLAHGSSPDGNPIWALYEYDQNGIRYVRLATYDGTTINHNNVIVDSNLADGRWHHWALTVDGSSGTQTVVKFYRDYVQIGTCTPSYLIDYPTGVHTFSIGGTGASPANIHGNYDELRVSEGVLPSSAFLRAQPQSTMLIVR